MGGGHPLLQIPCELMLKINVNVVIESGLFSLWNARKQLTRRVEHEYKN